MPERDTLVDCGVSSGAGMLSRVLVVHNFYRVRGGEDEQVEREIAVLRDAGVEVKLLSAHSSEMRLADRVRLWLSLGFWGGRNSRELAKIVRDWRPDLVHVHNTFPLLTPGVIRTSVRSGASTLVTLHNYRIFCANGVCLRAGRECFKCATPHSFYGVLNRCYRHSALLSGWVHALGFMLRHVLRRHRLVVVAPSAYAASMVMQCIGKHAPVAVLPNIVLSLPGGAVVPRTGVAYVGRLSGEKGLEDLIQAWRQCASSRHATLTIAGDGPMRSFVDSVSREDVSVRWVGPLRPSERDDLLRSSSVCVIPSRCPETFGLVAAEAALVGCPLIVTDCGALVATMGGPDCGVVVTPGDVNGLANAIDWVVDHPEGARSRARRAQAHVAGNYLPESFLSTLITCTTSPSLAAGVRPSR